MSDTPHSSKRRPPDHDVTGIDMNILIGCEESGTGRDAFAALGHKVLSCDLMPTRRRGPHYEGDIFDVIDYPWDLAIFHPPCTHTSVSGARHFAEKWMDGSGPAGVAFST